MDAVTVPVLLFASDADAAGRARVVITVPNPATVRDAVAQLHRVVTSVPGGRGLSSRPVVAVNQQYADYDQVLRAGDELALIPPVAGG
jgi:molybdopterin converting factor small subunit